MRLRLKSLIGTAIVVAFMAGIGYLASTNPLALVIIAMGFAGGVLLCVLYLVVDDFVEAYEKRKS